MQVNISPEEYSEFKMALKENKDAIYLSNYKFKSFTAGIFTTWGEFMNDERFKDVLFSSDSPTGKLSLDQMINYAISYMTCITAFDLFTSHCIKTKRIFHGDEDDYVMYCAGYNLIDNRVEMYFFSVGATTDVFKLGLEVLPEDYKPVAAPLDRYIKIRNFKRSSQLKGYSINCEYLSGDKVEHALKQFGY